MLKIEELFVDPCATVLETMKKLDETGQRILFIAPEGVLQAVVTDGDIRKFLLRGGTLNAPVEQAANFSPKSLPVSERGRARAELQKYGIDALPILNKKGAITDIVFACGVDVDNRKKVDIPVVMMAGGLGTRLYPYTKILPKPLIPVGEQPIAEMIIDRFREFGCHRFKMVVNYKKNMIKSYFGEMEKDYDLDFVDEEQFMGTGAGSACSRARWIPPSSSPTATPCWTWISGTCTKSIRPGATSSPWSAPSSITPCLTAWWNWVRTGASPPCGKNRN